MTELTTSADQLMDLVRKAGRISVPDAAKQLGVAEKTVQAWVDFLVEEHILGIEYKFTTPYIYVHNEERLEAASEDAKVLTLKDFKEVFLAYAREKEMMEDRLPQLWLDHLRYVAETQKQFFMDECQRRGVPQADALFEDYLEDLQDGT